MANGFNAEVGRGTDAESNLLCLELGVGCFHGGGLKRR